MEETKENYLEMMSNTQRLLIEQQMNIIMKNKTMFTAVQHVNERAIDYIKHIAPAVEQMNSSVVQTMQRYKEIYDSYITVIDNLSIIKLNQFRLNPDK